MTPVYIHRLENGGAEPIYTHEVIKLAPGARIIQSTLRGPSFLNRGTQLGPDVDLGKYSSANEHSAVIRADVGAYCAFGMRTSINPFNHPTAWLSTHEFQYHTRSYDWVREYNEFARLERTPEMFERVIVGNDVWLGHNVTVLAGVRIGDGAVAATGSVVTKNVPPYAIVAGVPATVKRLRFPEATIERLLNVKWWDLELPQLSGLPFNDTLKCLDRLEAIRAAARS